MLTDITDKTYTIISGL